jgi:hypothetical protein
VLLGIIRSSDGALAIKVSVSFKSISARSKENANVTVFESGFPGYEENVGTLHCNVRYQQTMS